MVAPLPLRLRPKRSPSSPVKRPTPHRSGFKLGLATAVFAVGLWSVGVWRSLEWHGYNALFQTRHTVFSTPGWDSRIAVVTIDDFTLEQYGQFPIARYYYTELLRQLEFSLPAAIGFDLLFLEPSPDDAEFAAALADSWNGVLAQGVDRQGQSLEIVPDLAEVTAQGHALITPDGDGVLRQVKPYYGETPAFSLALLQTYYNSLEASASPVLSKTPWPLTQPSLNSEHPVWINWPGPIATAAAPTCARPVPGHLAIYSLPCVLEGRVPGDAFANKVVLVGVTATGVDSLYTPFERSLPTGNVFLHAALVDNLLNQRLLRPVPGWLQGMGLVVLSFASVWLYRRSEGWGSGLIFMGGALGWFFLALVGLTFANLLLPVAAPIGTLLMGYMGVQLWHQWEKQQLMHLFEIYLSPQTANLVWSQKETILHHHTQPIQELVVTVLFIDIRGFTTISENLPPTQLIDWLNRYFTHMTECITAYGGTVDKYMGDAIMAVFSSADAANSPNSLETIQQHALDAVAASLEMWQSLQRLNRQLRQEGKPTIEVGIGVHTGLATAGNIGSAERLNYSFVGDAVNVAARLEAMNKVITRRNPYRVLVTDATYGYVCDRYSGYNQGRLKLRGREQDVLVYSITGTR
ncbi:MAG: adenylate/guanylate cyclase domain-containing protein [Synechococcales bacterium]|nr:adenylate/guanylate cyclase domain-containing protein [Synechococcales bacterium]